MDVYELREKVQIVKWYFQGKSYRQIHESFPEAFENRPIPCLKTIFRILQNFETHGCVSPQKHKKQELVNEERELKEALICVTAEQDPTVTSRQLAEVTDSSPTTVKRVLKKMVSDPTRPEKHMKFFPKTNFDV